MSIPVIMPKFEMTQEAGTVVCWLKAEGDNVVKGEALLEVQTDKVTMEVEAPASGVLVGIKAAAGDQVPIGQPIASILQPGERLDDAPPGEEGSGAGEGTSVVATPLARRVAGSHAVDLDAVPGTGPGGRRTKEDVLQYLKAQEEKGLDARVTAAPAARRLARQMGVDLRLVVGTGPGGRIQSIDVRQVGIQGREVDKVEDRPAVRRRVPFGAMRRAIAARMLASVRDAPQFSLSADVEMSRALEILQDWEDARGTSEHPRVTLTAFLVKACAWVLERNPALNASLEGDEIVEWADVNLGVAVALPEGLVVPVIHTADRLDLARIAAALHALTQRARAGELRTGDLAGGTFTLSNLGMFRVDRFTALLNPPQAGILAVGRVGHRPWVARENRLEVRPVATLTLTADHRLVDGAAASRFMGDLLTALEAPGVLV